MMSTDRVLHTLRLAKPLGHLPSFSLPHVPDGFAVCLTCGLMITADQLGSEPCSRREPNALELVIDPLPHEPQP